MILSTSEYAFASWLTKGWFDDGEHQIGATVGASHASSLLCLLLSDLRFDFIKTEVVGDFPEAAAREFAQVWLKRLRLSRGQAAVAMTDAEWAIMYEVCGGNALQLRRAVIEWERAMRRKDGDGRKTLEKGKQGHADVASSGSMAGLTDPSSRL